MRREKREVYELRIKRFLRHLELEQKMFIKRMPLTANYTHSVEPVPFSRREEGELKEIGKGGVWGKEWESAWFHINGKVPQEWRGTVVAHMNFGGESCVFDQQGVPVFGMTNHSVFAHNYGKDIYWLFNDAKGGEDIDFWVESAANAINGVNQPEDPMRNCPQRFGAYEGKVIDLELCLFDEEVWHLMLDIRAFESLRNGLGENSPRRNRVVKVVCEAIDIYADDYRNAAAARAHLRQLFETPANAIDLNVTAVGHAHIDTGWLWPVRETIRKCARTFGSQIAMLERYPDYVFGASQPQHYLFTKEHYPELYEKIKKYVKEGRWELQGGMWVEADCNLISGESMVRQFIHGKNFFMDEFGEDVKNLWLPDVFGYSASMPQIMRKSGVDYFLTQKISWSQFNTFPHNTFIWRGIDGTGVLTHFPPENNYNSVMKTDLMMHAQDRFKENSFIDEFISLFGMGDGGGGPKEEHIEAAIRLENLAGCPKVKMGRADKFFERLEKYRDQLETWYGELYLEYHRGTFTTQAKIKLGNRRLEQRLRDVEFVYSCLPLVDYPAADLDRLWKVLLINQFHDILPGSSISSVYERTEREYAESWGECDGLIAKAAEKLLSRDEDSLTLFNTLTCEYSDVVELPESWNGCGVSDSEGNDLPVQVECDKTVVGVTIPSQSFLTLRKSGKAGEVSLGSTLVLENDLIRYEFDDDGCLVSAFDKESGRETISGKGNVLSLYVDRPNHYDAWDIDCYYHLQENAKCVNATAIGSGLVRKGLKLEFTIGDSKIEQSVYLRHGSKRLDFVTHVSWKELHRMLRVAFNTAVVSDEAVFEIQYGYVKRTAHDNDNWDMAKFEVAAHKYADISDHDFGAAILNDCKYGHKIKNGTLDLNLLRSPTYPDPDADIGEHDFTYSYLPHKGTFVESKVIDESLLLNYKPVMVAGYAAGKAALPVSFESGSIALEVVKRAEKEDCLVVRLVEQKGRLSSGSLSPHAAGMTIAETDLMEWSDGETDGFAEPLAVTLKPFEIRTYKIWR